MWLRVGIEVAVLQETAENDLIHPVQLPEVWLEVERLHSQSVKTGQ